MTRILITPGVKERVSANAGRLLAGSWTPYTNREGEETGYYSFSMEQSVALALEIERELTAALTPEEDGA